MSHEPIIPWAIYSNLYGQPIQLLTCVRANELCVLNSNKLPAPGIRCLPEAALVPVDVTAPVNAKMSP
jgi:hypothetical protein